MMILNYFYSNLSSALTSYQHAMQSHKYGAGLHNQTYAMFYGGMNG